MKIFMFVYKHKNQTNIPVLERLLAFFLFLHYINIFLFLSIQCTCLMISDVISLYSLSVIEANVSIS